MKKYRGTAHVYLYTHINLCSVFPLCPTLSFESFPRAHHFPFCFCPIILMLSCFRHTGRYLCCRKYRYLLLWSVHFLMCIIICFAIIMSFNSKDKLNVPCIDYTAIRSMIITPIKSYYLLVWWSYPFWYKIHTILVWNSYHFGMKIIPFREIIPIFLHTIVFAVNETELFS